jgi:hypothetical protein
MPVAQAKHEYKAPTDLVREGVELAAVISSSPIVGTWKNVNPNTEGLLKLIIAQSGTGVTIEGFGACSPTPCVWGSVPAMNYAANVTGNSAVAFSATYTFSFKQTIVVGRLHVGPDAGQLLTVETFDHFTDGSGRSNYYAHYDLTKS